MQLQSLPKRLKRCLQKVVKTLFHREFPKSPFKLTKKGGGCCVLSCILFNFLLVSLFVESTKLNTGCDTFWARWSVSTLRFCRVTWHLLERRSGESDCANTYFCVNVNRRGGQREDYRGPAAQRSEAQGSACLAACRLASAANCLASF